MMFPEFIYENYHYDVQSDVLHISFCFRLNDRLAFEPTAFIPNRSFLNFHGLSKPTLDTLVFHIGMIELISYWKAYCPPTVVVKPFRLTDRQLAFWRKLYFNGLGEFFYTNNISATIDDFLQFRCEGEHFTAPIAEPLFASASSSAGAVGSHIVPIGGGKDSVVTLELLSADERPLPLIMNPRGATTECVAQAGYTMDEVLVIKRTIHPLLLDLNKQGALNGHTPFSAMLAFYTLLASALTGKRPNIALSNENSANESTVVGSNVNHQYSKSLEFENDFRSYVADFLSPEFNYYSFLRPLSELQIAMLFARFDKYFPVFKSCNVGSKTDVWCGHCAKCLFAYIILSPFIAPERLQAIFGKNMLDDSSLELEFNQLTGHAETKPFECVGTVSEVNSALSMTLAKWYGDRRPALLADYVPQPALTPLDSLFDGHNLPADDLHRLTAVLRDGSTTEQLFRYRELFNLLKDKEILIAGYGREGKSSHLLLQRLFPCRDFDVAHNNDELLAALDSKQYDLIIKSPGIPSFVLEGHCRPEIISSQADIFLQVYGDITIGVTGTKGKSTTSTLIYEILKRSKDYRPYLAGNIGVPLFDIIPQLDNGSLVVAELSCHQLEHIRRAPHTGVILNLFEEHLDHYHSYRDYQEAKMNMALRQREGDVCFYCRDNEDLVAAVARHQGEFNGKLQPYHYDGSMSDALSELEAVRIPLVGDHNIRNIIAAKKATSGYCDTNAFVDAIANFKGLEHRLEHVAVTGNVTYFNDSISTIPQATIEAVEALKEVQTLILGGFNRGIDYQPLAVFLSRNPLGQEVKNIVLFGSAGQEIKRQLELEGALQIPRQLLCQLDEHYDMDAAVRFAAENTESGHICLLSPAASSYDRYKNFEERGRHYKDCVMKIAQENARDLDHYIAIRRELHAHPDVSGCEQYAHDLIVSEMQRLKPTRLFTHVGGFGVVAYWQKHSHSGLTVAFRCDTDALPIGHRCGHDGHTTILLRFAEYVATHDMPNNVVLIFQPEEETGHGARKIFESGILQQLNVHAVYGLHNLPGYPKGSVVVCPGTFAMASTGVVYRLIGRPTHASTPEKGINPGLAAAEIIQKFSQMSTPQQMITLVGCEIGGEAFGTSAGEGRLMFTIRSASELDPFLDMCDKVVADIAGRYGLKTGRELRETFPLTCGVDGLRKDLEECLKTSFNVIERVEPFPWSEDFGEYLKNIKGVFFGIGSGEDHVELHHPDYDFPDDIIETGATCFRLIAENAR